MSEITAKATSKSFGGCLNPKTGRLLGSKSVVVGSYLVQFSKNLPRLRPASGALEKHMLQKMRNAVDFFLSHILSRHRLRPGVLPLPCCSLGQESPSTRYPKTFSQNLSLTKQYHRAWYKSTSPKTIRSLNFPLSSPFFLLSPEFYLEQVCCISYSLTPHGTFYIFFRFRRGRVVAADFFLAEPATEDAKLVETFPIIGPEL